MAGQNEKGWWRRGGLFAKYVMSLVGLVLFVLAINAALETWMIYRETRTSLTAAMSDKAEATARRIAQSMSDLERQVSWVTRASVSTLSSSRRFSDASAIVSSRNPANSRLSRSIGAPV